MINIHFLLYLIFTKLSHKDDLFLPQSHSHDMTPRYFAGDALGFISIAPFQTLQISNGGILRLLKTIHHGGSTYRKFLSLYPEVRCEPLDSLYFLRTSLNAFDRSLLHDLLFCYGWRESNWGALLAALAPAPEYRAMLEDRRPSLPYASRIVDLALAACGHPVPEQLVEHQHLLISIRSMLDELPAARIPLRPSLNAAMESQYIREVEHIRNIYRMHGTDAAKKQMTQGAIGYYGMSHKLWVANGALAYQPK